jgi:Nitroreductase family
MATTTVPTEIIKDALSLACRAPSLHNSQPWRWVSGDGALQLFLDPTRVMIYDHSRREALIGCGAVLHHLKVAMAVAGWRTHVDRFPDPSDPNHLASLEFTPMGHVSEGDRRRADAILIRRSDRLPFYAPTDWEAFEPLLRNVIDTAAVRLDAVPDDLRPQLVEASQISASLRLYDSAYHTEVGWWTGSFRSSDGIPYSSLVSAAEGDRVDVGRLFPLTRHGERRPEIPEDHAKILLLSTDSDDAADALACGEAVSAVLLECTRAGFATCTLTHITEVRTTREMVTTLMGFDRVPQVLIRVGVAPAIESVPPASPRRPVDDVFDLPGDGARDA